MAGRRAEEVVRAIAADELGFDRLRAGQERAAAALVEGRDVLAVMPTGAGKSAIYQIAGAAIPGVTIVVSPLLALQHDQVSSIGDHLGGAVQLNSALSATARAEVLARLRKEDVEFVLLAPEQLANDETRAAIEAATPTLFVVDEAHCISSWGHDFRPEYLRLGPFVESAGHPRVLALTATAAPPVRSEIIEQLRMRDPLVVVHGFRRPNIRLAVETFPDEAKKVAAVVDAVRDQDGTGIVYTATRQEAEELAAALVEAGVESRAYHAGLSTVERAATHARFKDGGRLVVAATTAFGMGIDAPHVRFVFHTVPPESIDAYYQELGRAGRDGAPADAVVFTAPDDRNGRRFFAGAAEIDVVTFEHLAALVASRGTVTVDELSEASDLTPGRLMVLLDRLAGDGAVAVDADGRVAWQATGIAPVAVAAAAHGRHEQYRTTERTRAQMMQRYLDSTACRWQLILGYFGEPDDEPCGHCDSCASGGGHATGEDGERRPFPVDATVTHEQWGRGQVIGYERDTMTVLFDDGGYRTLSVPLVDAGDLLHLAEPRGATRA